MFKKFLLCVLLMCALPLLAEVSVLSVVDEDKHTKKEDFWHTFEYYIIAPNSHEVGKCQATRIGKNWFATAAHCVAERCQNGCTLRMDLLEQPTSIFITAQHTPKKPIVFVHPLYSDSTLVAHDFALLKLDVANLPAVYYVRPHGKETKNTQISRGAFQKFLKQNPSARREFDRVLRPQLPPILVFDNATKRIDRKLSVISIFDGKRSIIPDPHPADYVKELGFAYTKNFGILQGMSGSGVMTNTGELAGIISAYVTIQVPGEKTTTEYFMFPVFNKDLTDFMQDIMGSDYYKLDRKDASPNYIARSPASHKEIIRIVNSMSKRK